MFCCQVSRKSAGIQFYSCKVKALVICLLVFNVVSKGMAAPSPLYNRDTIGHSPFSAPPAINSAATSDTSGALASNAATNSDDLNADSGLLNINTASIDELAEQLPGIGPSKARAIADWREQFGPFGFPEQLLEVPGVGPVTLDNILPLIYFGEITGRNAHATQLIEPTRLLSRHRTNHKGLRVDKIDAMEVQTRQAIALIVQKVVADSEAFEN